MIQTQAKIVDIQYSPNKLVAQITFAPDQIFSFHAGQFAFLEIPDTQDSEGKALKRAYSIGSSNDQLQTQWTFTTIVKKTREGGMSDYLTSTLRIGDIIKCTAPLWHLGKESKADTYLLISTGSGITPMYSIYQTLILHWNYSKIAHVFGERHQHYLIENIITSWTNTEQIKHFLHLSQDTKTWRASWHIQSSIDPALVFLDTSNIQVYICGKPIMVEDVVQQLLQRWISIENISFEKY